MQVWIRKAALATAFLGLTLGGASVASAQSHPLGDSLGKLDKDADEKISLAEWSADKAGLFKKIDANKDSAITREEATAYYVKVAPADDPKTRLRIDAIMTTDGNADGLVTRDELVAAALRDFKSRDTDGDGFITSQDKR